MYRSLHMYMWWVNYCWSSMYVCGPDCVYVFLFSLPCHTTDATSFPIFLHNNSTTGWLWIQAKLCLYSVSASVASLMSRLDQHALSGKNSLCLKMTQGTLQKLGVKRSLLHKVSRCISIFAPGFHFIWGMYNMCWTPAKLSYQHDGHSYALLI